MCGVVVTTNQGGADAHTKQHKTGSKNQNTEKGESDTRQEGGVVNMKQRQEMSSDTVTRTANLQNKTRQ